MAKAYIIDAVRTPRGKGRKHSERGPGGGLCDVHPQELLAQTLQQIASHSGVDPAGVDDVVIGNVSSVGEQGSNIARNAVLAADWPDVVTGVTLNRFCGSGLQAVNFAAMGVMSGQQDCVIGGGVESMSRVPMGSDGGGIDGQNTHLRKKLIQVPQGISADLIATLEGFSREQLDAFALQSQHYAGAAVEGGYFKSSLFGVKNPETGEIVLEADQHPRPSTTADGLARLKPVFARMGAHAAGPAGETLDQLALVRYPQVGEIQHVHTAGSSSGIVDGAAAVMVGSEAFVQAHGIKPRARFVSVATAGAEPVIMLTAPTDASRKALKKAGMQPSDIDLWEINEAFAVVPLQLMRNLDVPRDKVNVNGGAIALGHPLGATGAMLLGTALDELERRNLNTALITLCIGGGQAIATIIERV